MARRRLTIPSVLAVVFLSQTTFSSCGREAAPPTDARSRDVVVMDQSVRDVPALNDVARVDDTVTAPKDVPGKCVTISNHLYCMDDGGDCYVSVDPDAGPPLCA